MKSRIIITAIDNPTIQIVPQLSQGNIFVKIFEKDFRFSSLYWVGKILLDFVSLEKKFKAL